MVTGAEGIIITLLGILLAHQLKLSGRVAKIEGRLNSKVNKCQTRKKK